MRFEDEQYVRLFLRDTPTWLMLPWQGRACLALMLRKVDRAGIMELGAYDVEGLATTLAMPLEVVEVGFRALLKQRVITYSKKTGTVFWPRFLEAQEVRMSDQARKKLQRERDAGRALAEARGLRAPARKPARKRVTRRDDTSQNVTDRHTRSHAVTLSSAQPISAKPSPKRESACARPLSVGITIDRETAMPPAFAAIFEERLALRDPRPRGVTCETCWRDFASKRAGQTFPNPNALAGAWQNWVDKERGDPRAPSSGQPLVGAAGYRSGGELVARPPARGRDVLQQPVSGSWKTSAVIP